MSVKTWQPIKVCFCDHVNQQVALEGALVYPADWMPDQPPRILAHRCSKGIDCNLDGRPSCIWSGTNPVIDPFIES